MSKKFILDACCGPRYMWFNKKHPNTLYLDLRDEILQLSEKYGDIKISPDKVMDFRNLQLPNKSFKLVVFDPPHLKRAGTGSILGKKFGILNSESWPHDIKKGFSECWRVLEDYGILIFKWNDHDIKIKDILKLIPETPLFANKTSKSKYSKTYWFTFMKIPK